MPHEGGPVSSLLWWVSDGITSLTSWDTTHHRPPSPTIAHHCNLIQKNYIVCNCWNYAAVIFELRCSGFELFCSESAPRRSARYRAPRTPSVLSGPSTTPRPPGSLRIGACHVARTRRPTSGTSCVLSWSCFTPPSRNGCRISSSLVLRIEYTRMRSILDLTT
jgi:hypothetical protein